MTTLNVVTKKVALVKSMLHGLTRGVISYLRGGSFKSGFVSGLSSLFSVGTQGYGGFMGRTVIMAVVGGTASVLGGGKFASGAMAGAFMQMFNAEARKWIKELSIKQAYQLEQKIKALSKLSDKMFISTFGLSKDLGSMDVSILRYQLAENIRPYVLRTALETAAGNLIPQHNVVTAYQVFTTYVLPDIGIGIAFVPGTVEIRGIYETQ